MALTSEVLRTPDELNEALLNRMEALVSDLLVIRGMTTRGAVLPAKYRGEELPALKRFAERIFVALEQAVPVVQPWES